MYFLTSSSSTDNSNSGSMESIKKIFTNPILYIVIGCIVFLIICIYLLKRFVKAKPNSTTIILRRGKVYKVLDGEKAKCFLVPFIDSVGAVISNEEKEFTNDKLFINDGPNSLYKINYTLKYKPINPSEFFKYLNVLPNVLPSKLNDTLRLFADKGNVSVLLKDYREKANQLLEVVNETVSEYSIEVIEFKVNFIEPIGK